MKGATPFIPMIGPRAETDRTQSGTLLRNEVKQMRGATGLTVLALILAYVAALRGYLRALLVNANSLRRNEAQRSEAE